MKKSILVLAIPCLMALALSSKNALANIEDYEPHKNGLLKIQCRMSDITCYEWYVNEVKIKTVLGRAIIRVW